MRKDKCFQKINILVLKMLYILLIHATCTTTTITTAITASTITFTTIYTNIDIFFLQAVKISEAAQLFCVIQSLHIYALPVLYLQICAQG